MSILGFNIFSSFREIDEDQTYAVNEINEIQVNMVRERVRIIRTEAGNEIRFHYYGKSKQALKLVSEIDNKTVVVAAKCEDNPLPRNLDPTPEDMYLDVYIPEDYRENISINITTGIVQIDSIETACFTLDTSTGGLVADQIKAEKISIKTSTGSIDINKMNADDLNMKGTTSAVKIDECIVKTGIIETTTGGIDLKNCSGSLHVKANSGKVQVSYNEFVNQNLDIATTSGSIILSLPNAAEFQLEANTLSGKLKSDFKLNTIESKKIAGQIGTKSNQVVLKSSSGSISLLKNK